MREIKTELKILTPIGMLGYGIPAEHFWAGVDSGLDAIVVDAGSTDPGPYQLGLGTMIVSRQAYRRDLSLMLQACAERKVPVYISSAGGPGIDQHVDDTVAMIREIAAVEGYRFKLAAIYAEIDRAVVRSRLDAGRITECGPSGTLTHEAIEGATRIVAQMGCEPFARVLEDRPDIDIIVSGRAYDPAPYAGLCMLHGIDPGVCTGTWARWSNAAPTAPSRKAA